MAELKIAKSAFIHKTAILEGDITIGENVKIGPFSVLNGKIDLQKNVSIASHVAISGNTIIRSGTKIFQFSSIGEIPQDTKYKGEETFLEIGENNIIRENVTISPGTAQGGYVTKIGSSNLFMIGSHIGHDCIIENNSIIANNVSIAGHVYIGNHCIIGGNSGIHQFVRIGNYAMVGGMSGVTIDIPPFSLFTGNRGNKIRGLNIVGLKRNGFTINQISAIKKAFIEIFSNGNYFKNAEEIKKHNKDPNINLLLDFILVDSKRNICGWDKNTKEDV